MESKNSLECYITKNGLPHILESETAIDSILMNNNAVMEVLTEHGINEDHFHNTFMRDVYSTCKKFIDDGKDLDPLVVINDLRKKYKDEEVIKRNVEQLYEANILTEAVYTHIDNLIEYQQRSKQVIKAVELFDEGYNGRFVVERKETFSTLSETRRKWLENLTESGGILTPFRLVNAKTGGITGLAGLLATPKCGKSTISMQIGYYAVTQGTHVLYCDYENGSFEIMKRTLQAGQIVKCERRKELDEMVKNLDEEKLRPWGSNYCIYNATTIRDPESLKARIPKNKKCLVIIDSLQKLPMLCEGKRESIDTWLIELNRIKNRN